MKFYLQFCGFVVCYLFSATVVFAGTFTGDLTSANGQPDGKIDIFDYNFLLSNFGRPYTIFDYSTLLTHYGQSIPGLTLTLAPPAQVKFDASFSSSMVLQRGKPITLSGTAPSSVSLTIKLASATAQTTPDSTGHWQVTLPALPAGGPHLLTVSGGGTAQLTDVYIGDVYLCSGQSNMSMKLGAVLDGQAAIDRIASANLPLRLLPVTRHVKLAKSRAVTVPQLSWTAATKKSLPDFSAVCVLTGEKLAQQTHVPIGLIQSSIGGTPIEAWINYPDLATYPRATALVKTLTSVTSFSQLSSDIRACFEFQNAGVSYLGMIQPLKFHSLKAVIWYQGESNQGRAYEYQFLLPLLTKSYRNHFHDPNLPFFVVQLPTFAQGVNWAEIRAVQQQAAKTVPHLYTIPTLDLGLNTELHPKDKTPVAGRIAAAMLHHLYGMDQPFTGPTYVSSTIRGNTATVTFSLAGTGGNKLKSRMGAIGGFSLASADGKFYPAVATLTGDTTVTVSSHQVATPKYLRYAWSPNTLTATLESNTGWPAWPFRTDDIPFLTQSKSLADRPLWGGCGGTAAETMVEDWELE